MRLDRFYPIFDSADWIARMLPLGMKLVQLRIKDAPYDTVLTEVTRSESMCRKVGAILVVNDHWQIAIEAKCRFLHLGQEDLDNADLNAIRKSDLGLGISTHDDHELERAMSLDPEYIALGPIHPTILKKMKWREQGTKKLTDWKRRIGKTPLVAIGGMTVERAAEAFAAGADIVSAVTDITLNPDPEARVRDWIGATR